jgi:threonine aldolase
MLAKGRLLGLQFLTLLEGSTLEDTLYMKLALHADILADKLRNAIRDAGYPFLVESRTNQIFPILPDTLLDVLREKYSFSYDHQVDETNSAIRFCTSWATKESAVDELIADIRNFKV